MNKSNTLITRQLFAGVLLAMFLFIHVVKFTHHHNWKQHVPTGFVTGSEVFSTSQDCFVCDYHFIKDADNQTAAIDVQAPDIPLPFYTVYLSQRTASIGLYSSDRGPPSLV